MKIVLYTRDQRFRASQRHGGKGFFEFSLKRSAAGAVHEEWQ
jgi:hypothetical protein